MIPLIRSALIVVLLAMIAFFLSRLRLPAWVPIAAVILGAFLAGLGIGGMVNERRWQRVLRGPRR